MTDRCESESGSAGMLSRELFLRVLDGDRQAEEQFWNEALGVVYTIAQTLCRSKGVSFDVIDDVVQDSILSLVRQPAEKTASIDNWQAWLHAVVRNRLFDHLRRTSRRRTKSLDDPVGSDDAAEVMLAQLVPGESDTAGEVSYHELEGRVDAFLSELPKERAEVFRLYLQGMLQREIAERTGKPINTVGVWIYRTKLTLAEYLESSGWERNPR